MQESFLELKQSLAVIKPKFLNYCKELLVILLIKLSLRINEIYKILLNSYEAIIHCIGYALFEKPEHLCGFAYATQKSHILSKDWIT